MKSYTPKLKSNVIYTEKEGVMKLESLTLDGAELELNAQSSFIIKQMIEGKSIDDIYQYIYINSNASDLKEIEIQVDSFLLNLMSLQDYLEEDITGKLYKKYFSYQNFYFDPFGKHTKEYFNNYNFEEIFINFYYEKKDILSNKFLGNIFYNQMFFIIEKTNSEITIYLLQSQDRLDMTELVAIFTYQKNKKQTIDTKSLGKTINMYVKVFKQVDNIHSKMIVLKTHSLETIPDIFSSYKDCGKLESEYDGMDCRIGVVEC